MLCTTRRNPMTSISNTIDKFLVLNELGKTDSINLNKLIRLLENGKVETERAIQELYSDAKNPDGSFRNFLKRLRDAIKTAAENQEDIRLKNLLESIKVITHQKTASMPGYISIEAGSEPTGKLPNANRQYDNKRFVQNEVSNVNDKPLEENELKLFLSYSSENAELANDLARMLEKRSEKSNRPIRVWKMLDMLPDQDFKAQIREKLDESDFGLAALSQAYLNSQFIAEEEAHYMLKNDKILLVGLDSCWNGQKKTPAKFFARMNRSFEGKTTDWQKKIKDIRNIYAYHLRETTEGTFFGNCSNEAVQERFVDGLIESISEIMKRREEKKKKRTEELKKCQERNKQEYSSRHFVDNEAAVIWHQSQTESYWRKK